MNVAEIMEQRNAFSFEVFPPKTDVGMEKLCGEGGVLEKLYTLNPDYISCTYGAGGTNVGKNLEVLKKIKADGKCTPVTHFTCVANTKEGIKEQLNTYLDHGINHMLALRGDRNPDFPPKTDFLHADELVSFIHRRGDFGVSGACYPEGHPESPDMIHDIRYLKQKVDAGAQHLVSQLFFDNDDFYRFVERCRIAGINVPIEAGIMPVLNKGSIERMVSMCGASMPRKLTRILARYGDHPQAMREAGMAYAIDQIADLIASGVDGVHLYTMNNSAVARQISDSVASIRTV